MRLNMQKFDGLFHSTFWGAFMHRLTDNEKNTVMMEGMAKTEAKLVELMNGHDFISGTDQPMLIDIHVYPMLEKLVMQEGSSWDS